MRETAENPRFPQEGPKPREDCRCASFSVLRTTEAVFFLRSSESAVGTVVGMSMLRSLRAVRVTWPSALSFADLSGNVPGARRAAATGGRSHMHHLADVRERRPSLASLSFTARSDRVATCGHRHRLSPPGRSVLPSLVGEAAPCRTAPRARRPWIYVVPALADGHSVSDPAALTAINGASFGLSAVVLAFLRFGGTSRTEPSEQPASVLLEAWRGVATVATMPMVRVVLLASSAALFCGGLFNVAELPFATRELNAGDAGFSILVALFGLGFVIGSLSGAGGGAPQQLRARYELGLLLMALSLVGLSLEPVLFVAALAFNHRRGIGNGRCWYTSV